jgi:hypothetical protein
MAPRKLEHSFYEWRNELAAQLNVVCMLAIEVDAVHSALLELWERASLGGIRDPVRRRELNRFDVYVSQLSETITKLLTEAQKAASLVVQHGL